MFDTSSSKKKAKQAIKILLVSHLNHFKPITMNTTLLWKNVVSLSIYLLLILGLFGYVYQAQAQECQSEHVKIQMLGTRGPEFLDDRASTGYLIWLDNKARVIIDTGPGTVQRFKQSSARYEDIKLILFTHFHVDHSADFPAYVKGGFFTEKSEDLEIIGPSGTDFIASADQFVKRILGEKTGAYPYLSHYLDPKSQSAYKIRVRTVPWSYQNLDIKTIYDKGNIVVKTVPVHHGPFPALGYRIETAGCVISFTGDMSGRLRAMPDLASGSDILVAHNAIPENATGIPALLHMKPSYIGKMAKEAGVKKVLLTHLMERSINVQGDTMRLIRQSYGGPLEFPQDLDVIHP
jgi:ribonuclease BN (tRNA processing enzyme)